MTVLGFIKDKIIDPVKASDKPLSPADKCRLEFMGWTCNAWGVSVSCSCVAYDTMVYDPLLTHDPHTWLISACVSTWQMLLKDRDRAVKKRDNLRKQLNCEPGSPDTYHPILFP
jgi:hypothetical protein